MGWLAREQWQKPSPAEDVGNPRSVPVICNVVKEEAPTTLFFFFWNGARPVGQKRVLRALKLSCKKKKKMKTEGYLIARMKITFKLHKTSYRKLKFSFKVMIFSQP